MNGNKKELALRFENLAGVFELTDTDLAKIQGGGGNGRDGWQNQPDCHNWHKHHDCDDWRHNRHNWHKHHDCDDWQNRHHHHRHHC